MQDYLITPMDSTQTNPTQGIYEQSTFLGNQQNFFDVFLNFYTFWQIFQVFPTRRKRKTKFSLRGLTAQGRGLLSAIPRHAQSARARPTTKAHATRGLQPRQAPPERGPRGATAHGGCGNGQAKKAARPEARGSCVAQECNLRPWVNSCPLRFHVCSCSVQFLCSFFPSFVVSLAPFNFLVLFYSRFFQ